MTSPRYRFAHDVFLHVADADRRLRWSDAALAVRCAPGRRHALRRRHALVHAQRGRPVRRSPGVRGAVARRRPARPLGPPRARPRVSRTPTTVRLRSRCWRRAPTCGRARTPWLCTSGGISPFGFLAVDRIDEAVALYDAQLDDATTPFRLCDMTSLLWRLELARPRRGRPMGRRWPIDGTRSRNATRAASSTCTPRSTFVRRPDHPGCRPVVRRARRPARPRLPRSTTSSSRSSKPLVAALRAGDPDELDALEPTLHRIGGSNAQRSIIPLTAGAWR